MLSTSDKKWICKMAAIVVRSIGAIVAAQMTTMAAVNAANRIEKLYAKDIDRLDLEGYDR